MWKLVFAITAFAYVCASGVYAGDVQQEVKSKALAHYIMAVTYDLNGRPVEAITEYERAARLDSTQVLPHLRLAAYYARGGMYDKTVSQLNTVLKLDPVNFQAHYLLALVYSTQKKYDLAAGEYEQILKTGSKDNPGNLEIYTYLAQLYFSQNK